jgi:hypothetical protein
MTENPEQKRPQMATNPEQQKPQMTTNPDSGGHHEHRERQERIVGLLEMLTDRIEQVHDLAMFPTDVKSREWWTERDACERKGLSYDVMRKPENRKYLPNHGMPARVMHNGRYRKMYHWSWVAEWLPMDAAAIDAVLHRGEWLGRVDDHGRVVHQES